MRNFEIKKETPLGVSLQVELAGLEPASKHLCHKLSTCLVYYYLSAGNRKQTNQLPA